MISGSLTRNITFLMRQKYCFKVISLTGVLTMGKVTKFYWILFISKNYVPIFMPNISLTAINIGK